MHIQGLEPLLTVVLSQYQPSQPDDSVARALAGTLVGGFLIFWFIGFGLYMGWCVLIGHLAKQKGHGFGSWVIFAFLSTPFVAALFLAAAAQRPTPWSTYENSASEPMPLRRGSMLGQ